MGLRVVARDGGRLTANAVSALGYRAREGLRQAYLQEHLAGGPAAPPRDRRHREAEEKLGLLARWSATVQASDRQLTDLVSSSTSCPSSSLAASLRS